MARTVAAALTLATACGAAPRPPPAAAPSNQAAPAAADGAGRCVPDEETLCLPDLPLRLHDGTWLPPSALVGKVVVVVPARYDDAPAIGHAADVLARLDPTGHRTVGLVVPDDASVAAALAQNNWPPRLELLDPLAGVRFGLGYGTVAAVYDRAGEVQHRWMYGVVRGDLGVVVQRLLDAP